MTKITTKLTIFDELRWARDNIDFLRNRIKQLEAEIDKLEDERDRWQEMWGIESTKFANSVELFYQAEAERDEARRWARYLWRECQELREQVVELCRRACERSE